MPSTDTEMDTEENEQSLVECHSCLDQVTLDETTAHEDNDWCDACYSSLESCYECDDLHLDGNLITSDDDGGSRCSDCHHDTHTNCSDCDEHINLDLNNYSHYFDSVVCSGCIDQRYSICNGCDELCLDADISFDEDDQEFYCHDCGQDNLGYTGRLVCMRRYKRPPKLQVTNVEHHLTLKWRENNYSP